MPGSQRLVQQRGGTLAIGRDHARHPVWGRGPRERVEPLGQRRVEQVEPVQMQAVEEPRHQHAGAGVAHGLLEWAGPPLIGQHQRLAVQHGAAAGQCTAQLD